MSGIEAAGLALAILPLIVSAAQHYEDCFRPFLKYRKFAKEADVFRKLFRVQKAIFRNQCGILLQELVEHDAALAILNGARQLSKFDDDLERQLNEFLGESREPCAEIMKAIHDKLSDMESESQQLETIVEQERQQDSHSSKHKAWRTRVANKLRFCFGNSSRLNQNLTALRLMNGDFVTLSQQMTKSSVNQRGAPKHAAQVIPVELQRYHTIGQASCQVYEALSKACTKHTEHQALFRVKVEQELVHGIQGSRFKFDMAFTSPKSSSSAQQDDLLWFVINSIVGDNDTDPSVEGIADERKEDLVQSLKPQIEPSEVVAAKKQKKRVRFHASTPPPPVPILAAIPIPSSLDSFDSMRRDLCDYLRRHIRRPVSEGVWPCVLENRGNCKNILYPSSTSSCMQLRQATSLGDLISSVTEQGCNGSIPLFERVRLARVLAIAVLQYHATPWLATSWRSENIYLIASEDSASSQTVHGLSSPHLNVKIKHSNEQLPRVSASSPYDFARNALLFSLAVVLLEIAHSARLETMYRPLDLMNGEENPYTQFFAARRLAKSDYSNLGPRYHKIVERLLECDFACGDDLGSRQLQAAVHNEVICPLEQLEQGLRQLYLGT